MPLGRDIRRMSRKGEERTARALGGKRQPASGATPWAKGDVKSEEWLVERKDTMGQQFTLRVADLRKLRSQALHEDKTGVFVVAFNGSEPPMEVAVIPMSLFKMLTERDDESR